MKRKKSQIGWQFHSPDYDAMSQEAKAAVHILEARALLTGQREFTGEDLERWFAVLTEGVHHG
jgi:hypothetical protein